MDIIRITKTGSELYTKAMELYKISFPEHEQRLPASQAEIMGNGAYHFDAICDNGKFVGEILYWDIGGAYYIEHFAFCLKSAICTTGSGYSMHTPTCR